MKVYLFGNPDLKEDSWVVDISKQLAKDFPATKFVFIKPNQDLPFKNKEDVLILDTADGIAKPIIIEDKDLGKIKLSPRLSTHDFDLGFQLKYLQKLGKLGKVKILGIPLKGNFDYSSIHSIFKKFVAQDMQGS